MPFPIHTPRINNNDDFLRVAAVLVSAGSFVRPGETLIEVESDKATMTVEAEREGHVLAVLVSEGATVPVGAIALWLGDSPTEAIPDLPTASAAATADSASAPDGAAAITAKARLLLEQYGLAASNVPKSGERLTVADVEAYIAAHPPAVGTRAMPPQAPPPDTEAKALPAPSIRRPCEPARRGMIQTVRWQRDHAAATYLEVPYDPEPWETYAAAFRKTHRLLVSPLLSLMAFRLVALTREMPEINSTVLEQADGAVEVAYQTVNLGFTVQSGEILYLVVVAGAEALDETGFVTKLGDLQRRAMARKLKPSELAGPTVCFSSMARWGVSRHVPVLAPHTAIMVAHAATDNGPVRSAILGATYDHRVLSGFQTARLLRALALPPNPEASGQS